jgi:hypothetical protein
MARPPTGGISLRLAQRAVGQVARRTFDGALRTGPDGSEFVMDQPLSITALPDGSACAFYGAAYNELLRRLADFEGAMLHLRCRSRGDAVCAWHTAAAEVYE